MGFAPGDSPRVAIASDGTMAAIHEPSRIVVLELPGCAAFAEVEIASDALASDVAWVGAPPRLLVIARYTAHAVAHLVDPYGPRTVAELRIDAPVQLAAAVGVHALVLGGAAPTLLTAGDSQLVSHPFPARTVPLAAGAAAGKLLVALAGALEEWDPQKRIPGRRHKLPRAGAVTAVGGNDRLAWCTWRDAPARIDALPLAGRGPARAEELPEPIAQIAAHPRSDLLVCLGGSTGRIYVVDLDGRHGVRVVGPEGIERAEAVGLVVGRVDGVLAAQSHRPIAVVTLDVLERDPRSATFSGEDATPIAAHQQAQATTVQLAPPGLAAVGQDWREALVAWARVAASDVALAGEPPAAPVLDAQLARFELPASLRPVLALLYAAHLSGERGAAPIDVARVARGWSEALGRGALAARGLALYEDSRVRLAPALQRALDEA
jgi:hypothetical protein